MKLALLSAAVLCLAAALPGDDAAAIAAQKPLYPLTTCPMSGRPLGSGGMVEVDLVKDGQLIALCCSHCKADFDKAPADVVKKVQDAIAAAQLANYPLDTCPISGEKLDENAKSFVVASKLVKTCCNDCKKEVLGNPAKAVAAIDAAYIAKQEKDYPLTTCPMSGEPLGDKPVKVLYGVTLVEFCCKDCAKDFAKDPKPALAKIAAARAGKPAAPAKDDKAPAGGEGHEKHGG